MSGEALGLSLIVPLQLEHAAYIVHGLERDQLLTAALAAAVDKEGSGTGPLDAALVLGNPPRRQAASFEEGLHAIWRRLRAGAPLVVGAETLAGRMRRRRFGAMTSGDVRRAALSLHAPIRRSWHVYPSLSRPTILLTAGAAIELRTLVLDQAGLGAGVGRALVSMGRWPILSNLSVPAVLWEFRK